MQLDLDDVGGAKELARYRISVAKEDLDDACQNFDNGKYRASNNRAYYAIFRAVAACLALEFKSYKHHSQAIGSFTRDFVRTGIFPRDIGRKVSKAQEVRQASDYDDFYIISVDEARTQVENAKEIVGLIEQYLKEQGV